MTVRRARSREAPLGLVLRDTLLTADEYRAKRIGDAVPSVGKTCAGPSDSPGPGATRRS